ncbi:TonB-dependent receptor [Aliarcobacter vitoriensis]|uniref:TonB-dependent siderophore receptor n=1 Tax=Aliarcobacter vitoriensis TaxID=2011099 RepID=A0A366MT31_9BACT|nr:TonB-dependent siderophore receptor [Aliarcobacter vitoriensis]RBQ29013.1 TonB-dependent siderophore receptor [Aliarcobacter vitoriensis]
MKNKTNKVIFCSIFASSILFANETTVLEDITVSANKMEENIKNVPQSITVIDEEEIELKGIKRISDVIKEIPNLSSSNLYYEQVNFRGINTSLFTATNPVVIYIDGIPHSNRFGYDTSLTNVERIEVLRGPQGTIYGKDSIGGVINIVTKQSDNLEGFVSTEYGSNDYMEGKFNVNVPIIKDKLYINTNGLVSKDDGWITNHNSAQDNDANDEKIHKLNFNVIYKPTDRLSSKISIFNSKDKKYFIEGGIIPSTNINDYKRKDFKNTNFETDSYNDTKNNSQALNLTYDFDNYILSSTTTNSKTDINFNYDFDWSNNGANDNLNIFADTQLKNFTQELRLQNKDNSNIKWLTGLYYEKDKFNNKKYGSEYPAYLYGNIFGTDNIYTNYVSQTSSQTLAAFGQMIIPIVEDIDLTLGARYQRIKKDIDLNYFFNPIGSNVAPVYELDAENTWKTFLPKFALSYKINDNLTSFLSISKGYLPGGFNYYADSGTIDNNKFDAQESINYELGLKSYLLDNKLNLSASIFYMDIDDIHIFNFDGMRMTTSNGGKATSQGLELETKYLFNDNWSIDSSLGLVKAEYDEYINSNNKDNTIENTPSHNFNLGISYQNQNGIYGRFDIFNQGRKYFDAANTLKENSYTTANIKIGYMFDDLDVYAYMKNITDESYLTTSTQMPTGNLITFGEGRFTGIGVKYSF